MWLISPNGSGIPVSWPKIRTCGPNDISSSTSPAIAVARCATDFHSITIATMIITRPIGPKNVLSSVALTLRCLVSSAFPASACRENQPSEATSVT